MDCSGVKHHASEGAVLNVLVVVGHVYPPLPGLIRLEAGVESAIVLGDWAAQRPVSGRIGSDLQKLRPRCMMRIDLK